MKSAEEAKSTTATFNIVQFIKNECHLKEETLAGKLRAATDNVNDRLTKMWNLPDPESDTSSDSDFSVVDSILLDEGDRLTKMWNLESDTSSDSNFGMIDSMLPDEGDCPMEKDAEQTQNVIEDEPSFNDKPMNEYQTRTLTEAESTGTTSAITTEETEVAVNPNQVHGKQTYFLNRVEHESMEYMITTRVLQGGDFFILLDSFTCHDMRKPQNDQQKHENNVMIHNQCVFGELDTIAHLIDNRGVSPSVLDEVSAHIKTITTVIK